MKLLSCCPASQVGFGSQHNVQPKGQNNQSTRRSEQTTGCKDHQAGEGACAGQATVPSGSTANSSSKQQLPASLGSKQQLPSSLGSEIAAPWQLPSSPQVHPHKHARHGWREGDALRLQGACGTAWKGKLYTHLRVRVPGVVAHFHLIAARGPQG